MTGITEYLRALIVSAFALAILAGCAESSVPDATGKGSISAVNAIPASPILTSLIEERALGVMGYKGSVTRQNFDDLSYNFNVDFRFIGDSNTTRIATHFIDMVVDTDYTLVLTGSVAAPVVTQWERPTREWEDTETVFEVAFAHLSPSLGDVDVYFALTGTIPVLGEERAKLSYGDRVPEIDLESEEYEVIITDRDDPATILYQSASVIFSARASHIITIFDADEAITGNISVRSISGTGSANELPDPNFLPTIRTVHAAFGTANIDIFRDEDFTAPIYSNLGFGETTGDLPVPVESVLYTYTAVGNPGAIIDEDLQITTPGQRSSTILAGMQGSDLRRIFLIGNRRSLETHAKFRIIQAAANFDTLDFYLVDTGTDITDLNPTIGGLNFANGTDFVGQIANSYDIVLTVPDEKTLLLPPIRIDLVNGDVVELLIMDTVDPAVADVMVTRF
jgi:hypothetical protein